MTLPSIMGSFIRGTAHCTNHVEDHVRLIDVACIDLKQSVEVKLFFLSCGWGSAVLLNFINQCQTVSSGYRRMSVADKTSRILGFRETSVDQKRLS